MSQILYTLQALYQFYKSAHWLAKGELFYQYHLLFERLYEDFDEEMDQLVELSLITGESSEKFKPQIIMQEAAKLMPKFGDSLSNLQSAFNLEEKLLSTIEAIDAKSTPTGLYNHLAAIAQAHTSKVYLLQSSLK